MKDLELRLIDTPGSLARMASTLGAALVSVEGGGVFVADGVGVAHFLISDSDADTAAQALRTAGIDVTAVHEVLLTRLRQDIPGQLGALCRQLAAASVNITTQYSDHTGQLVLLVDHPDQARTVLSAWAPDAATATPSPNVMET